MLDSQNSKLAASLLDDLRAKLADQAKKLLRIPEAQADEFADAVAVAVARDWGGQHIYIPQCMAERLAQRNEAIFKAFTGNNAAELAKAYELSRQHIYRIIKAERERRRPRQHSLFAP